MKYDDIAMDLHAKLCEQIHETCVAKNKDYGSSAHDSYEQFGMISYIIRLNDKLNRLKSLTKGEKQLVNDESIEDTLLDMANYCLLAITDLKYEQFENELKKGE